MPQDKEIKYFANPDDSGGLNSDDSDFSLGPNEWVNAENVRVGSTDAGVINTVESIGSTIIRSTPQPSATFLRIGEVKDIVGNRILRFWYNVHGPWHKITAYSLEDEIEYTVLLSSQVTGGLNFSKYYLIHSGTVVNGLLYWTDNLNPQRRINIDAGINLNHPGYAPTVTPYITPIVQEVLTVLRKPPLNPVTVTKVTQSSPVVINNFMIDFSGQISLRYYYRDGEVSVPSVYSLLIPYNSASDTYNAVDIVVSSEEYIEQDVQRVDVLLKFGNENTFYLIKSWDKSIPAQAQEIEDHNDGTQLLTFRYYNDTVGEALDEAYSLKPFDSVPILSEALQPFGNRLGLGNNLEGYDTPITTSLNGQLQENQNGGPIIGQWWEVQYTDLSGPEPVYNQIAYVFRLTGVGTDSGFYAIDWTPYFVSPPPPTTLDYAADPTILFIGAGTDNVITYFYSTAFWSVTGMSPYNPGSFTLTNSPFTASVIGAKAFKTGGFYKMSIVFYDFGDRKCGVAGAASISGVSMDQVSFQIPDRSYDTASFVTGVNWSLSNSNAVSEIPDWATHYSIVLTKCLTTRFFLQAQTKNNGITSSMTYVSKNAATGEYTFSTSAYASTLFGVGVNVSNLANFSMGYSFQDGDIINIYINSDPTVYRLRVLDQEGIWVVAELQDLGTLNASTEALFQIFTPYASFINEPYYEGAQTFKINDPGTPSRTYSILAGNIEGDVFILNRGASPDDYLTENMSPNDKFYQNWFTDAGRPNFIDRIGQQLKETNISYSNVLIPGTKTNGLSSFDALDERNIPQECGPIRKLQITSKVQDELGVVLLAICEKETASIYVGEVQLFGSTAPSTLAQAPEVLGTINILKGSYGTINPECVVEYRGNVYWIDMYNGKLIQYSLNGLFPISNYKMTRFWKLFCDQFLSMTTAQIEVLGSLPYVFMEVDPHHKELLISIPKLLNIPPKGYLPDYPSTIYPFDIYDGQGKTIVYKLGLDAGRPKFLGAYSFNPEGFCAIQNKLFSSKNGVLWEHNQTTSYCNFYGVQYKPKIMFVSNMYNDAPKSYDNISIQANMGPILTYAYNDDPYQQSTDLVDFDYRPLEGIFYATFYRNKLQPTFSGYTTSGLLTGEKMRSISLKIMLEFTITNIPLELKIVKIGFTISKGHRLEKK